MFPGFWWALHFFPFFFFLCFFPKFWNWVFNQAGPVSMPSFFPLHEWVCVREQCNQWCGFALIPLLWNSPPASFRSSHCMAAELSRVKVEYAEGCMCTLVLAASDSLGSLSLAHPSLRPLYSGWEVGWGWWGRWDNGEVLPSEKPPESLLSPTSFYASAPFPLVLCCLPLPLDLFLQLPSQYFPSLSRASVVRVLIFLLCHVKLTGVGPGERVTW